MKSKFKKSLLTLLASVTMLSALVIPPPPKVNAASDVTVNLSDQKQVIRGFGVLTIRSGSGI